MSERANSPVVTFGCRLNTSESQIIESHLKNLGVEHSIIVVNSCAVTQNAERESFAKVAQLIKQNANSEFPKQIFVTGCSSQLNSEKYLKLGVDRVITNDEKLLIDSYSNKSVSTADTPPKSCDPPKVIRVEGKTRAFVQIQNGCDHDCTFCVIYKARGKNRSVSVANLVDQIRSLVEEGCMEIVLTGVDITDYGKDLSPSMTLAKLIQKILILVPGLARLRLSSVDVAEIDEELFGVLSKSETILPYFHLSLQAGSDLILKRMKRRHSKANIVNFCEKMLTFRPNSVFGADVIAGFPTENEELFSETANLLTSIPQFIFLHVFPFSAHSGTPAARMPQVDGRIIKSRAKILRDIGKNNIRKFVSQKANSAEKVLFESNNIGKTEQFLNVRLKNNKSELRNNNLSGKIIHTTTTDMIFKSTKSEEELGEFLYLECDITV